PPPPAVTVILEGPSAGEGRVTPPLPAARPPRFIGLRRVIHGNNAVAELKEGPFHLDPGQPWRPTASRSLLEETPPGRHGPGGVFVPQTLTPRPPSLSQGPAEAVRFLPGGRGPLASPPLARQECLAHRKNATAATGPWIRGKGE